LDNLFGEIVFWVLALITIGSALLVVTIRDVFRAALLLISTFVGVAGLFVMLNAEFLAVVQILIYVGAISVLVVFAVMLTKGVSEGNKATSIQPVALMAGLLFLVVLVWSIVQAEWDLLPRELPVPFSEVFVTTPQTLGRLLISEYVLPFEIAGILLLAVVIGALALVRESEEE